MLRVVGIFLGTLLFFSFLESEGGVPSDNGISFEDVESHFLLKSEFANDAAALSKYTQVLEHLQRKQLIYKDQSDFVEYLYYFTHRKLLKSYQQYPTIGETLALGRYDCLTATTIYSLILNELNINHTIVETNYHIYILVNPDQWNEILIETTDPRSGFISNPDDIRLAKMKYREDNYAKRNTLIKFDFDIERRLEGSELLGLLYYNQSIRALNQDQWVKARNLSYNAFEFYPNERVKSLINVLEGNSNASL